MILTWWSAQWCQPCKRMAPIVEQVIKETGWTLRKIDIDVEIPEGIQGIPTFQVYDPEFGDSSPRIVGTVTKQELLKLGGVV